MDKNIWWTLNDIADCGSSYELEVYGNIDFEFIALTKFGICCLQFTASWRKPFWTIMKEVMMIN